MTSKHEDKTLEGLGAVINSPKSLTHGKHCVIELYDDRVSKYKVEIQSKIGKWIGWYTVQELKFDAVVN